jgi:hypothetical protein
MAEKMPIRIREVAVASGDTYDYVKSPIVPPGEIWCLQGIAYENETGARGTFRRYIEGHGYNHYIKEHQLPKAGELISTDRVIFLTPGERLVIRQASCTASDVLALYVHGYKLHSKFIPEEVA